jgi:uncharacterized membrane protein
MVMAVINLSCGILLFLLGLIVKVFKVSGLIAGYNTASEEEKKKYNVEKLTRYVGNFIMLLSLILIVSGLLFLLIDGEGFILGIVSWSLFMLAAIAGLIYLNTGNRLKNQP